MTDAAMPDKNGVPSADMEDFLGASMALNKAGLEPELQI